MTCKHEWEEIKGFTATYKNCKHCGVKFEDIEEDSGTLTLEMLEEARDRVLNHTSYYDFEKYINGKWKEIYKSHAIDAALCGVSDCYIDTSGKIEKRNGYDKYDIYNAISEDEIYTTIKVAQVEFIPEHKLTTEDIIEEGTYYIHVSEYRTFIIGHTQVELFAGYYEITYD